MENEKKESGDAHNARLKEVSVFGGMPLFTTGDMDGLPLLSSGGRLDPYAELFVARRDSAASSNV